MFRLLFAWSLVFVANQAAAQHTADFLIRAEDRWANGDEAYSRSFRADYLEHETEARDDAILNLKERVGRRCARVLATPEDELPFLEVYSPLPPSCIWINVSDDNHLQLCRFQDVQTREQAYCRMPLLAPVVKLGDIQVENGTLTNLSSQPIRPGVDRLVALAIQPWELDRFAASESILAVRMHVMARFRAADSFVRLGSVEGPYENRGTRIIWPYAQRFLMTLPADADRIEIYLEAERSYYGNCYDDDMPNCTLSGPAPPALINNGGRNFHLDLSR